MFPHSSANSGLPLSLAHLELRGGTLGDLTVYTGDAGVALMLLRVAMNNKEKRRLGLRLVLRSWLGLDRVRLELVHRKGTGRARGV